MSKAAKITLGGFTYEAFRNVSIFGIKGKKALSFGKARPAIICGGVLILR